MEVFEKSETVDPEVRAYVYSLVNALGGSSSVDDTYVIGDDALGALKDLRRWLSLYDEKTNRFDVKRCLADANVVKGDLLEILASWPEEGPLSRSKSRLALGLACLELLVPLTWPIDLDLEKATVNHHRHAPYLQLAQVAYKQAVLQHDCARILRTTIRVALPSLALPRRERSRRDEGIIKLVLYFLRNMTMIMQPGHLPSQVNENEIGRSAVIAAFQSQDVFSLLLTISSNIGDEFVEQDVIILDILFHLLRGVDPRKLFLKESALITEETNDLSDLLIKEKSMLNSYNKVAPTRHNRFGTMIWVKRDNEKMSTVSGQSYITNKDDTLHYMDASKKWTKPLYRGRQGQGPSDISDFGSQVDLDEKGRERLRSFVKDFIDSSFNPLFTSLRKAIESEAERVLPSTHVRQYFYLISWFLAAESARREQSPPSNHDENYFTYIATVLDQSTLVLINRKMQYAFDNKMWHDLQSTLLCLTQILHTVQRMSESKDEEDQEIAENIQNRIFYEESTHDRLAQVLRTYAHQGLAYLDAVTDCIHVFVRMLERYSKENVDLQIRSKRRARKKRKDKAAAQAPLDGEDPANPYQDEDDAEEEQEMYRAASERKFDFARFSAKFMSQPCVDTFLALTHLYADLTPAQLKRCHRYFYRLAFKNDMAVFLFRADILRLFLKMVQGPGGLPSKTAVFKEWEQLIQQIFRRCIKWLERTSLGEGWREVAMVEMLFSKMQGTFFYLQNGYENVVEKKPPPELEIRGDFPKLKVAMAFMWEMEKQDLLHWVASKCEMAADERQAWMDEQQARAQVSASVEDEEPSRPSLEELSPPISLTTHTDTEDQKLNCFADKHLRLLLTTMGLKLESPREDKKAQWVFPPEMTPTELRSLAFDLKNTNGETDFLTEGSSAKDLVGVKRAPRATTAFDDDDNDSDEGGDGGVLNDALFPPNLREKGKKRAADDTERPRKRRRHNQNELTEEELQERAEARARHEREKNAKIKSNLFVTESDDESDEERDAEFFRQEEERRKATAGLIRSALSRQGGPSASKKKSNKGAKKAASKKRASPALVHSDDESDQESSGGLGQPAVLSSRSTRDRIFDESDSDASTGNGNYFQKMLDDAGDNAADPDSTPSTSPPAPEVASLTSPALKEILNNATTKTTAIGEGVGEDDDEDDEDAPITKPIARRRAVRAGFIIDSDSE